MQTERITIGGRALEFARVPALRDDSPTLVFLHEGLGSVELWRDFPTTVAQRTGYCALVYSRYGNGFSSPLAEARDVRYMHDEALVVLPALLEELKIADVILVGHSDGGSIALMYAGAHVESVRGLVLEAPHVFVEDLSVRSIAAVKAEYEASGLRERMARYHTDVDRTFYGWNDIWLAAEFRDWNIEACIESVRVPILSVQGLNDEYGTPAQLESIGRRTRGRMDRLLLANCGHAPHRDRTSTVESVAAAWILALRT